MQGIQLLLTIQAGLLIYHQVTTWLDLSPFNGARHYTAKERAAETGTNFILMSLPPTGYALHVHSLMLFGVVYYFVLLLFEVIIWWIPYFSSPSGKWRATYNALLAVATSNVGAKDALHDWIHTYQRIHADTLSVLPPKENRIVPNVEHMILHVWTALAAVATAMYYFT